MDSGAVPSTAASRTGVIAFYTFTCLENRNRRGSFMQTELVSCSSSCINEHIPTFLLAVHRAASIHFPYIYNETTFNYYRVTVLFLIFFPKTFASFM